MQTFSKQAQTLPTALHCFIRQGIFAIQASSQTHFAFYSRQRLDASSHLAHNQHMKTIRTEINGCIQRRGGTHTLHPSICLCVGCILSPESLTTVCSSGFILLPS
ncbi:Uncharacterised protein [Shigella sonnei]|nr:Uncharacterised protein [Shigella sonnei]